MSEILQEEVKKLRARVDAIEKGIATPPPMGAHTIAPEEMREAQQHWLSTLDHFKASRPILPHDQRTLFELIKMYDYKSVLYAIYGMRFEQATPSFDPSANISLSRLFDRKLFDKFVNAGAKQRHKDKLKRGIA